MHRTNQRSWILLGLGLFTYALLAFGDETPLYVQATRAEVREKPEANAKSLTALKRGDTVVVVEQQGMWLKVSHQNHTGWIHKLFLSAHPPVGQNALLKDTDETLEKSSRKRSSSYSVAASARGLMTDERKRGGQEKYRADYEALQALDASELPEPKVIRFAEEAKLGVER